MTLPFLPTFDVYIGFNPTYGGTTLTTAQTQALPGSGASNAYWTNVSTYLRDFQTQSGRQHFLDRIEAGTLTMTLNNRTGYFLNGTTNGTGYVIQTRMPIAITATYGGTTYPVFWGLIDDIREKIGDQLNYDIEVTASDLLKYLSLKYMSSNSFWPTYAQSAHASNWFRCDNVTTYQVTAATGNGTQILYNCINSFSVGQLVTVSGLGISSGSSLNVGTATITGASPTQFTVASSLIGVSSGTGSAFPCSLTDQIGSVTATYYGLVSSPQYGAMIYDPDNCADLTNGTNVASGYIQLGLTNWYGMDLWVLGSSIQGSYITSGNYKASSGTSYAVSLDVSSSGYLQAISTHTGTITTTLNVSDGYWHHVGLVVVGTTLYLYGDGTWTSIDTVYASQPYLTGSTEVGSSLANLYSLAAYVDEIIISGSGVTQAEVDNRYVAGTLLQLPTNAVQSSVASGQRIAQILTLAGFGSISNGALAIPSGTYYISNAYNTPVDYNSASTFGYVNVEPWYWDSPVTTSTGLDLTNEITDTDVGSFFQSPDGKFQFFDQNFYGTWTWNSTTKTGTWTPSYTTPSGAQVWSDDGSSAYSYLGDTLEVNRDDADLWTSVAVTPQSGTQQIYENTEAEAQWGYTTLQQTDTLHPSLTAALSTATFLGYLFRSPLPRVTNVELAAETNDGGNVVAILGTTLGQVVQFVHNAPGSSTSGSYPSVQGKINQPMIVESKSLSFDSETGEFHGSFSLDPYPVRT